jgi:hypothetical protein
VASKATTVRALDGSTVYCQIDKCDRPALFLFQGANLGCLALCETHARERAALAQLALPPAKPSASETAGRRMSHAVA